jgi:L-malate glycosyltransferase
VPISKLLRDRWLPGNGPLRVMHLTDRFGVGGLELGILKIVNGLDDSRIVSSVCSLRPGDPLTLRPGVKLFVLNRREGNDPYLVVDLYRLLKRERPHVVHTHQWGTLLEGAVAARLGGVPYHVHGEHGTLDTRRRNVWAQRILWRRVDRMLSVSSRLAERMARNIGFPLSRISVIRNGLDLNRFQPREDKASAKLALGIGPNTLLIGTVGRTVPVKDHATFLRALALLQSTGTRCSVVIAGTGPLLEETKQLAKSLDLHDVRILGTRDDVEAVLPAFDIFVLSSRSEGLSNTIQEAMACGLPVVATQVGGADELVVDGQTGILVPPGNPEAFADALATLVHDVELRKRFGGAGHARARSHFGLGRMIREYEDMYLDLGASKTWIPRH